MRRRFSGRLSLCTVVLVFLVGLTAATDLKRIDDPELVFEEDFTQPRAWSTHACEYSFRRVADDFLLGPSYHYIAYRENRIYWTRLPGAPDIRNFVFEVTARSASATSERVEQWNVVFRDQRSDPPAYYRLRVFTNGSFDLNLNQFDEWHTVQERTYSEHIARDRKPNHVRLSVRGPEFIVEINGVEVAYVYDTSIQEPGRVALGVSTGSDFPYVHAVFTNVRLYRLP